MYMVHALWAMQRHKSWVESTSLQKGTTAQRERFTVHRIDPGRLHQSAFKLNNMQRLLHDANKLLDFAHFNEVPDGAATHME